MCNNLTELHTAASSGDRTVLKRIIENFGTHMLEEKDTFGRTPLILAIIHNQVDCALILLKAGAQVDNSDNSGQTALHIAVNKGFTRCVKLLLSQGARWQQRDFAGVTSLHLAAIHSSSKCLSILLKELKSGEIDNQDSSKKTALHWSAAYSNLDHVTILLNQGPNLCIPDEEGKTPLHWAASSSNSKALECLKLLLEKESSTVLNWQDYEGRSVLHIAVATGLPEMVHFLASFENCNVDIMDNMFRTPLHWAAKLGFSNKVDILLNKRASHKCTDGNGATPLHYAAHYNHAETVRIFLSRHYVCDIGDSEGRTAFIWAAARNAVDVIKVMSVCGLDFNTADKNGSTAFHAAAIQGHVGSLELLQELGAGLDAEDGAGMTAFLRACELGRSKATQLLLDLGANQAATDLDGRSSLHWCAIGGHAYLCQVLLQYGIQCNTQDAFGMSPLHYACLNGYINCVSVLLESKADPHVVDNEGKTALHWAVLSDHMGVVKLLSERDVDINAMALFKEWLTPLDCAIIKENFEMLSLLREYGALTYNEIREIAARRIQVWYRTLKQFIYMPKSEFSFSESLDSKYKTANCETIYFDIKSIDTVKELSFVPLKKFKNGTSLCPNSRNCAELEKKLLPEYKVPNEIATSLFSPEKCMNKDTAALVIQKAWKRYFLVKRFQQMRKKVKTVFTSEDCRKEAEKEWQDQLAHFSKQL